MILITGGAGVVGRRLSRGLIERGFEIRVLDRPGTRLEGLDVDLRHGDITDPTTLKGLFDGVETVYHLAAVILPPDPGMFQIVNVQGTRNVVDAAAEAGVKHFVHISSASVVYPHPTAYSLSKRDGEEIVRSQGSMQYTIVRPTLVYDENGGEEFMKYLGFLQRFPVVPFIGRGDSLKNPVHTDDIMQGLIAIAGNPNAYGKTYGFSGGENLSMRELSRLMLKHRGKRRVFVSIPVWACRAVAWGLGKVMANPPLTWQMIAGITQDANLDHADATRDLGYEPKGVTEGFQLCWPL
jgi:NADH dehydrogenase